MKKFILLTTSLIFLIGCGQNSNLYLSDSTQLANTNAFLPPDTSNPKPPSGGNCNEKSLKTNAFLPLDPSNPKPIPCSTATPPVSVPPNSGDCNDNKSVGSNAFLPKPPCRK